MNSLPPSENLPDPIPIDNWRVLCYRGSEYPHYEISDQGNVRRVVASRGTRKLKILKPTRSRVSQYLQVILSVKQIHTACRIHQAVAHTFLGPQPEGTNINHVNGDKCDNRANNLEYTSPRENSKHAVLLGLIDRKGTKHPMAKLSEDQAREIRRLCNETNLSLAEIGRGFNVHWGTVRGIREGQRWKHLWDKP